METISLVNISYVKKILSSKEGLKHISYVIIDVEGKETRSRLETKGRKKNTWKKTCHFLVLLSFLLGFEKKKNHFFQKIVMFFVFIVRSFFFGRKHQQKQGV